MISLPRVDLTSYTAYVSKLDAALADEELSKLINANALQNLPSVTLETNNADVQNVQKCQDSAVWLAQEYTSALELTCKTACGSNGTVVQISDTDEYYHRGTRLSSGVWCIINPPNCNLRTTYVVATLSGTTCRTKYPNLFGGSTGDRIVACSDAAYDTGGVLWDYSRNEAVDPSTVEMTNEDELIADGQYRFRCKFGDDQDGNAWLPHPMNRFHPLRDPCTNTIYRAHRTVGANVSATGWSCDCGDSTVTRVKNLNSSDAKSTCTSCFRETQEGKSQQPYDCFTVNSDYLAINNLPPCLGTALTNFGNKCGTISLDLNTVGSTQDEYLGPTNLASGALGNRFGIAHKKLL